MKKNRKIIHKEKVHLINEIFNYLAILSVLWILLYRIESLRQFCIDVATEYIPNFVGDVTSSLNDFASDFELPFHF